MTLGLAEIVGCIAGLLLGSFLNVCIARIPRGESVVHPGSHCPACAHPIRWFDNLPLLSWIILRGRCRDCGAAISWRYPAIEFAMGLWGYATALRFYNLHSFTANPDFAGSTIDTWGHYGALYLGFALLGFLLLALIVIDWQTQRLPDALTLTGIAAGLFLICIQAIFLGPTDDQIVLNSAKQLRLSSPGSFAARGNVFLTGPESLIFGRLAAICGAALLLLFIRWTYQALRKREGLGLGDVKLLAMVAAFLGFWPAVLTLFLGVLLGTAWAIPLLLRRRADALTRLPLGSFLGVAGLISALFGQPILAWYRGLFL